MSDRCAPTVEHQRRDAPDPPGSRPDLDEAVATLRLVPAPRGDGRTRHNWRTLARIATDDLDVARLVEAHLDAVTILDELAGPEPRVGSRWAVWAAGSSTEKLRATLTRDRWRLAGAKPWCSGATGGACTDALITAQADDGQRLFALDLTDPGVSVRPDTWQGVGMRGSAAATIDLDHVAVTAVGGPRSYLDRPGFWHGAIAVAAAWFGGAVAVAAPLRRAGAGGRLDGHGLAHLGAVDAALAAARATLVGAAAEVDDPAARTEPPTRARRRALQVRAVVETAVETSLTRTGRATGPGPLAGDAAHARRVADLQLYVRQSHAERDLATLGELAHDVEDLL